MRHRWGHLLRWGGAHRTLPDVEHRAAILCFHGVTARRPDPGVESDCLDVREFRKLLHVLRSSFHVIPLAELVQAVQERRSPPPRSIVLTFDDGYANNCDVAAEELARLRFPWSAFLPAALIENRRRQWVDDVRILIHRGGRERLSFDWGDEPIAIDLTTHQRRAEAVTRMHQLCRYLPEAERARRLEAFYACFSADRIESLRTAYPSFEPMTWDQARQLKSAGVDVGSHALNHIALGPQPPDVIRHEVFAARDLLQARLGDHSPHFSYPYGREEAVSDETEAVLNEAGYTCGLTLEQDVVECNSSHRMRLPRLIVSAQAGRVLFGLWQRFVR